MSYFTWKLLWPFLNWCYFLFSSMAMEGDCESPDQACTKMINNEFIHQKVNIRTNCRVNCFVFLEVPCWEWVHVRNLTFTLYNGDNNRHFITKETRLRWYFLVLYISLYCNICTCTDSFYLYCYLRN